MRPLTVAKYAILILLLPSMILLPPFIAGTQTYPIAVVSGTSMIPTFQPGTLVVIQGVPSNQVVPNGTIIAYTPGQVGISFLDSILRPVIVHRVIGVNIQNGTITYTTKGDNNKLVDSPSPTSQNVIGKVVLAIPYGGVVVAFFTSAPGMVAIIGILVLYYADGYYKENDKKHDLLKELAKLVESGDLAPAKFAKLEISIKYLDSESSNESVREMYAWWAGHAKVAVEPVECPVCKKRMLSMKADRSEVTFCPTCGFTHPQPRSKPEVPSQS